MNARILFEDRGIRCRLEIAYENGDVCIRDFVQVSKLVNFCKSHGCDVLVEDCHTVDHIDNFNWIGLMKTN